MTYVAFAAQEPGKLGRTLLRIMHYELFARWRANRFAKEVAFGIARYAIIHAGSNGAAIIGNPGMWRKQLARRVLANLGDAERAELRRASSLLSTEGKVYGFQQRAGEALDRVILKWNNSAGKNVPALPGWDDDAISGSFNAVFQKSPLAEDIR